MIKIGERNTSASVTAYFDTVRVYLQENPCWGAELLQQAGEYRWRISAARCYSKGPFGSKVIDEDPDCLVAWGVTGRQSSLAYRIEREDDTHIRITPVAYLERTRKSAMVVTLAVLFLLPVILAPLIARWHEVTVLRASRVYLPTFCRYLEK